MPLHQYLSEQSLAEFLTMSSTCDRPSVWFWLLLMHMAGSNQSITHDLGPFCAPRVRT